MKIYIKKISKKFMVFTFVLTMCIGIMSVSAAAANDKESLNFQGVVYNKENINGKIGYPSFNEGSRQIEYKDKDGNLIGIRRVGKDYSRKVDQYKIQVGRQYFVDVMNDHDNLDLVGVVTQVYEKPWGLKFLGLTQRTIKIKIKIDDNERVFECPLNFYDVYETPVDENVLIVDAL